jgi:hypothetical protein
MYLFLRAPGFLDFLLRVGGVVVMVFIATFSNISAILWLSVLLEEETKLPE